MSGLPSSLYTFLACVLVCPYSIALQPTCTTTGWLVYRYNSTAPNIYCLYLTTVSLAEGSGAPLPCFNEQVNFLLLVTTDRTSIYPRLIWGGKVARWNGDCFNPCFCMPGDSGLWQLLKDSIPINGRQLTNSLRAIESCPLSLHPTSTKNRSPDSPLPPHTRPGIPSQDTNTQISVG